MAHQMISHWSRETSDQSVLHKLISSLLNQLLFLHFLLRLKKRRQLKSQSDKSVNEQNPAIIFCPDTIPNVGEPNKKADLQRVQTKPSAGSGKKEILLSLW